MRLVACSSDNEQVRSEIIEWMVDEELVEKLIDLLNNDETKDSDVHTLVIKKKILRPKSETGKFFFFISLKC